MPAASPVVGALMDALALQRGVGDRVRPVDLDAASRCEGWTVRQVLVHSIGVTRKFSDFASGDTDEPHAPAGDLLGPDHRSALRATATGARTAWAAVDLGRTCRLSFGTFPADLAAGINLFDVLAHTWDVADPLGLPLDEDDTLWLAGLDAAQQVVGGPGRDAVHYGAASPVPATASPMHRFLAHLGRGRAHERGPGGAPG